MARIENLPRRRKRRRRRTRIAKIVAIARVIGEHWRTQEGVNAALLDELAEATRPDAAIVRSGFGDLQQAIDAAFAPDKVSAFAEAVESAVGAASRLVDAIKGVR